MSSAKGMFAAFASDSDNEEEMKVVRDKKKAQAQKVVKDETREVVGKRRTEEGDYSSYTDKKPARGRGGRGRGARGDRGGRGRGGYQGEDGEFRGRGRGRARGERGGYRGDRGDRRGRGRGYGGRGEGGRGRGGYEGRNDTYSKFATRKEVLGDQANAEHAEGERNYGGRHQKHEGYDKRSGTGYGREVKKGGAGKGGWGNQDEASKKYEHIPAEDAAAIASTEAPAEGAEITQSPPVDVEPEQAKEPEPEPEPEVNNLTYLEWKAQQKANKAGTKKAEGRKPEEIKLKGIEKYNKDDQSVKAGNTGIRKNEVHNIGGIKGDVEVGFQPVGEEVEEDYERPQRGRGDRGGRGRGGRGRGRGGFNDGPREDRPQRGGRGGRGRGGKFVAQEDDFPSL